MFDADVFRSMGCTVKLKRDKDIMKSPVGAPTFCEAVVGKRVREASIVFAVISALCSLRFLRFRLDYTMRTTLLNSCRLALSQYDACMSFAFENIVGIRLTDLQAMQCTLPSRYAGFGPRSPFLHADAAYVASLAQTVVRASTIWAEQGAVVSSLGNPAVDRELARMPCRDTLVFPTAADDLAINYRGRIPEDRCELFPTTNQE